MHFVFVKRTSQPLSHSLTTESSDWSDNAGITWPVVACCGSEGQSMVHLCVDLRIVPSGMVTLILLFVGRTSFTDALAEMKWSVVPLSSSPWCCCISWFMFTLHLFIMWVVSSSSVSANTL